MFKEFRDFAVKGNLLDLAVAFILGAAFGAVITSLVKDILMPPIGLILGRVDFGNLFLALDGQTYASLKAAQDAGAPTINYGLFITTLINFIIIAFVMFLMVRAANRFKQKSLPEGAPSTKECPYCYSTIPTKATRCPECTSELAKTS
jgi:large conductance mechanosensitive channel